MASVSSYGPRVSSLTESPSIPGGLRGFACVSECRFIHGPTPPPLPPPHKTKTDSCKPGRVSGLLMGPVCLVLAAFSLLFSCLFSLAAIYLSLS